MKMSSGAMCKFGWRTGWVGLCAVMVFSQFLNCANAYYATEVFSAQPSFAALQQDSGADYSFPLEGLRFEEAKMFGSHVAAIGSHGVAVSDDRGRVWMFEADPEDASAVSESGYVFFESEFYEGSDEVSVPIAGCDDVLVVVDEALEVYVWDVEVGNFTLNQTIEEPSFNRSNAVRLGRSVSISCEYSLARIVANTGGPLPRAVLGVDGDGYNMTRFPPIEGYRSRLYVYDRDVGTGMWAHTATLGEELDSENVIWGSRSYYEDVSDVYCGRNIPPLMRFSLDGDYIVSMGDDQLNSIFVFTYDADQDKWEFEAITDGYCHTPCPSFQKGSAARSYRMTSRATVGVARRDTEYAPICDNGVCGPSETDETFADPVIVLTCSQWFDWGTYTFQPSVQVQLLTRETIIDPCTFNSEKQWVPTSLSTASDSALKLWTANQVEVEYDEDGSSVWLSPFVMPQFTAVAQPDVQFYASSTVDFWVGAPAEDSQAGQPSAGAVYRITVDPHGNVDDASSGTIENPALATVDSGFTSPFSRALDFLGSTPLSLTDIVGSGNQPHRVRVTTVLPRPDKPILISALIDRPATRSVAEPPDSKHIPQSTPDSRFGASIDTMGTWLVATHGTKACLYWNADGPDAPNNGKKHAEDDTQPSDAPLRDDGSKPIFHSCPFNPQVDTYPDSVYPTTRRRRTQEAHSGRGEESGMRTSSGGEEDMLTQSSASDPTSNTQTFAKGIVWMRHVAAHRGMHAQASRLDSLLDRNFEQDQAIKVLESTFTSFHTFLHKPRKNSIARPLPSYEEMAIGADGEQVEDDGEEDKKTVKKTFVTPLNVTVTGGKHRYVHAAPSAARASSPPPRSIARHVHHALTTFPRAPSKSTEAPQLPDTFSEFLDQIPSTNFQPTRSRGRKLLQTSLDVQPERGEVSTIVDEFDGFASLAQIRNSFAGHTLVRFLEGSSASDHLPRLVVLGPVTRNSSGYESVIEWSLSVYSPSFPSFPGASSVSESFSSAHPTNVTWVRSANLTLYRSPSEDDPRAAFVPCVFPGNAPCQLGEGGDLFCPGSNNGKTQVKTQMCANTMERMVVPDGFGEEAEKFGMQNHVCGGRDAEGELVFFADHADETTHEARLRAFCVDMRTSSPALYELDGIDAGMAGVDGPVFGPDRFLNLSLIAPSDSGWEQQPAAGALLRTTSILGKPTILFTQNSRRLRGVTLDVTKPNGYEAQQHLQNNIVNVHPQRDFTVLPDGSTALFINPSSNGNGIRVFTFNDDNSNSIWFRENIPWPEELTKSGSHLRCGTKIVWEGGLWEQDGLILVTCPRAELTSQDSVRAALTVSVSLDEQYPTGDYAAVFLKQVATLANGEFAGSEADDFTSTIGSEEYSSLGFIAAHLAKWTHSDAPQIAQGDFPSAKGLFDQFTGAVAVARTSSTKRNSLRPVQAGANVARIFVQTGYGLFIAERVVVHVDPFTGIDSQDGSGGRPLASADKALSLACPYPTLCAPVVFHRTPLDGLPFTASIASSGTGSSNHLELRGLGMDRSILKVDSRDLRPSVSYVTLRDVTVVGTGSANLTQKVALRDPESGLSSVSGLLSDAVCCRGGIFDVTNGRLALYRTRLQFGAADGPGGLVSLSTAEFLAEDSVFVGGAAAKGGSISAESGSRVTITQSSFIASRAVRNSGGAIFVEGESEVRLSGIHARWCTSSNSGGFLYATDGSAVILSDSELVQNHADNSGGAIGLEFNGITIVRSYLGGNSAFGQGGAISTSLTSGDQRPVVCVGCVVVGNRAYYARGGGLSVGSGTSARLVASVFAYNTAQSGAGAVFVGANGIVNEMTNAFVGNGGSDFGSGGAVYVSSDAHWGSSRKSWWARNVAMGGAGIMAEKARVLINRADFTNQVFEGAGGGASMVSTYGVWKYVHFEENVAQPITHYSSAVLSIVANAMDREAILGPTPGIGAPFSGSWFGSFQETRRGSAARAGSPRSVLWDNNRASQIAFDRFAPWTPQVVDEVLSSDGSQALEDADGWLTTLTEYGFDGLREGGNIFNVELPPRGPVDYALLPLGADLRIALNVSHDHPAWEHYVTSRAIGAGLAVGTLNERWDSIDLIGATFVNNSASAGAGGGVAVRGFIDDAGCQNAPAICGCYRANSMVRFLGMSRQSFTNNTAAAGADVYWNHLPPYGVFSLTPEFQRMGAFPNETRDRSCFFDRNDLGPPFDNSYSYDDDTGGTSGGARLLEEGTGFADDDFQFDGPRSRRKIPSVSSHAFHIVTQHRYGMLDSIQPGDSLAEAAHRREQEDVIKLELRDFYGHRITPTSLGGEAVTVTMNLDTFHGGFSLASAQFKTEFNSRGRAEIFDTRVFGGFDNPTISLRIFAEPSFGLTEVYHPFEVRERCDGRAGLSDSGLECRECVGAEVAVDSFTNKLGIVCEECPGGSAPNFTERVEGTCRECVPGTYRSAANSFDQECSPCEPGFYMPESGKESCIEAEGGEVVTTFGATAPTTCTAGYVPTSNNDGCDPCTADRTYAQPGFDSCETCPGGWIADEFHTGCKACGNGTYQSGNDCPACEGANEVKLGGEAGACTECPAGSAPDRATSFGSCALCPPGTASDRTTGTCEACEAGQANELYGQDECEDCPPGRYSADGAVRCTACAPNTIAPLGGLTSCDACPSGFFSVDGIECGPCPAGTVPTKEGTCARCPRGKIAKEGDQACTPCEQGTVSNYDNTKCLPCPGTGASCTGVELTVPNGWWWEPEETSINITATGDVLVYLDDETYMHECFSASACIVNLDGFVKKIEKDFLVGRYGGGVSSTDEDDTRRLLMVQRKRGDWDFSTPQTLPSTTNSRFFEPYTDPSSNGSLSVQCATGHTGPLCATCEVGYAMLPSGDCTECWDPAVNTLMMIVIPLVAALLAALLVHRTRSSARHAWKKGSVEQGAIIRVLLNYLKINVVLGEFGVRAPKLIEDMRQSADTVTSGLSFDLPPVQCTLKDFTFVGFFYGLFWMPLIFTIGAAMVCGVFYTVALCRMRSSGVPSEQDSSRNRKATEADYAHLKKRWYSIWISAVVVLLFLLYSTIVSYTFSAFDYYPQPIKGKVYLERDFRVVQGTPNADLLTAGAVVSLIIYVIGIPAVAVWLLYVRRDRLIDKDVFQTLGFAYSGYSVGRLEHYMAMVADHRRKRREQRQKALVSQLEALRQAVDTLGGDEGVSTASPGEKSIVRPATGSLEDEENGGMLRAAGKHHGKRKTPRKRGRRGSIEFMEQMLDQEHHEIQSDVAMRKTVEKAAHSGAQAHRFWYWEAVVLARLVAVAALAVFVSEPFLQSFVASWMVIAALSLHLLAKPYEDFLLNFLEGFGLAATLITQLGSLLWYNYTDVQTETGVTIVLIFVNLVAIIVLLLAIILSAIPRPVLVLLFCCFNRTVTAPPITPTDEPTTTTSNFVADLFFPPKRAVVTRLLEELSRDEKIAARGVSPDDVSIPFPAASSTTPSPLKEHVFVAGTSAKERARLAAASSVGAGKDMEAIANLEKTVRKLASSGKLDKEGQDGLKSLVRHATSSFIRKEAARAAEEDNVMGAVEAHADAIQVADYSDSDDDDGDDTDSGDGAGEATALSPTSRATTEIA